MTRKLLAVIAATFILASCSQPEDPTTSAYWIAQLENKEKRAEARRFAEQGRQMRGELKELEAWFVDRGHLSKDWRKDWEL